MEVEHRLSENYIFGESLEYGLIEKEMRKLKCLLVVVLVACGIAEAGELNMVDSIKYYNNRAIDYYWGSNLDSAEYLFFKSLSLASTVYPEDHTEMADLYNNLGVLYMRKWNYSEAIIYLDRAKNIFKESEDSVAIAISYSNIGRCYRKLGDFDQAINYYAEAIYLLKDNNADEAIQRTVEILNRKAILEIDRKNYLNAIYISRLAIDIYDNMRLAQKITHHTLYITLAEAYSFSGEYDSCVYYYEKSLLLLDDNSGYQNYRVMYVHEQIAANDIRFKQIEKALRELEKIQKAYLNSSIDSIFYARIQIQKGQCFELTRSYKEAIECYNWVSDYYIKRSAGLSNGLYASNFDAITLLKHRALCYLNWYNSIGQVDKLELALNDFKDVVSLISNSRKGYLTVESKLQLAESEGEIYNMGLACAIELFNTTGSEQYLETALFFSEKGKSAVLSEILNDEKAKAFAGIPSDVLNKEQKLKRSLAYYKEKQYYEAAKREPDSVLLELYQQYILDNTANYQQLKRTLETNYADYFTLKYRDNSVSIQAIQQKLTRDESLLEYQLADSILYIFHITKKTSAIYQVTADSMFYKAVDSYMQQYKEFNFSYNNANVYGSYEEKAFDLYKQLFPKTIREKLKRNIIVIPDGVLSYVPFESLVCSNNVEHVKSFADLDYMLYHHTVSYAYSGTLFCDAASTSDRKLFNTVLAIAPDYSNSTKNTEQFATADLSFRNKLTPLPNAPAEVELVASYIGGEAATGRQATKEYFNSVADNYDILHLAMHTLIDDNNALYSKLVFYDSDYSNEEGFLNISEIFGLNLKSKLAVLSACNSGDGEYKKGEGIMSLSRGFAYAGCQSLVLTLWQVEDESAMLLMKYFYKNLRKGYSKAEALNRAKIKVLQTADETVKHPFFWSSYILVGNKAPMYYNASFKVVALAVVLSLLFVVGVWARFRQKQKCFVKNV